MFPQNRDKAISTHLKREAWSGKAPLRCSRCEKEKSPPIPDLFIYLWTSLLLEVDVAANQSYCDGYDDVKTEDQEAQRHPPDMAIGGSHSGGHDQTNDGENHHQGHGDQQQPAYGVAVVPWGDDASKKRIGV
jgi:hypothetical protein